MPKTIACPRCSGTGIFEGFGVCYRCNGRKRVSKPRPSKPQAAIVETPEEHDARMLKLLGAADFEVWSRGYDWDA